MDEYQKASMEASKLMDALSPDQLKQSKYLGENEHYRFYNVPGRHGRICVLAPNRQITQEEWIEFNESMAEIIYKIMIEHETKKRLKRSDIYSKEERN